MNMHASSPIRVCQIVTSLRMGGMERMVCDLMGGLHARGIQSVLCCTDEKGELFEGAPAEAKLCGYRRPGIGVIDWRLVYKILRFVKHNHVSLIHAHNHAPHLYGVIVSFLTGIPLVVTRHGQGYQDKPRVRFLKRLLAGKTKTMVMVSEDAKQVALANRTLSADDSITVIPNGIDIRKFRSREGGAPDALRARLGIPENAIVIGSVGRLSPEKNYSLLVRAFGRLVAKAGTVVSFAPETPHLNPLPQGERKEGNQEGTPLHPLPLGERAGVRVSSSPFLLLVGDGPDRSVIEAEIVRLNLKDCCKLVGMQSDVLPWLHVMDIFCLSSDSEGMSISLLEAGACGLPSVVTDVGGNHEVIKDGFSGIVVPMRDELAMTEALDRLSGNAPLRHAMGVTSRLRVEERFSLDAMIDGYVKIYKNALG